MTSRVMLVEDNSDEESLTQRGLHKAGYGENVVVARDGAAALEMLLGMEQLPDLVLLDLKLPKVDGAEVVRQIRKSGHLRQLCVVIFTSSSEPRDIARCYHAGCNSYVIKPVTYENYISTVEHISAYWLGVNAAPMLTR